MFWSRGNADERIATRGAEWFVFENGLIREIRSYYQKLDQTTELDSFPYEAQGYSVPGMERSPIHADADRYAPDQDN